jgi:phosphoglycolate/pyridoxal phosphate phosphatase family enzyme
MERQLAKARQLLDKYSCLIFDCDGVLWRGNDSVPHAQDFLKLAASQGKKCYFLTNTSLYGRQDIKEKLVKLMDFDVDASHIFTANSLAAAHIKANLGHKKKAYVIGRQVLVQEVQNTGIEVLPGYSHDDKYGNFTYESQADKNFDDIDLVVMGYDDRINYFKFAFAYYALQSGADLVSTNADKSTNSYAFPHLKTLGNGSFVAAIESASGKKAFVAGKPNPAIFDLISAEHHGIEKDACLFIGDNLHTDIMFANGAGVDSLLVLTGVTETHRLDDLLKAHDSGKPTFVADDLS